MYFDWWISLGQKADHIMLTYKTLKIDPWIKSKVAKTLEEARKIINDSDSSLFDSQLAPSEAQNESNGKTSSDNRIAIYFEDENQCQFQATQFPISKRTLKLWSLMCANPAASKMISILFISMMPELYQVRFETDYKLASLYYRYRNFYPNELKNSNPFILDSTCNSFYFF